MTLQCFQSDCGKQIQVELDDHVYINATRLCLSSGKAWSNYKQNATTLRYLSALAKNLEMPVEPYLDSNEGSPGFPRGHPRHPHPALIIQVVGGSNDGRGTWVHRRVAIHLAQWISPEFSVWVTDLIERYATGQLTRNKVGEIQSCLGTQDWRAPQVYFGMVDGTFSNLRCVTNGQTCELDPSLHFT